MQNKIFSLLKKKYPQFVLKISSILSVIFLRLIFKFMNTNKIKKNPTTEIKEKLKKSKFDLLTNENDFLVKNLKKAG